MCSSLQMPRSCGEIRPSGDTAAASVKTSPRRPPPGCQMDEMPVVGEAIDDEYWHIGETAMRLAQRDIAQPEFAQQVRHGADIPAADVCPIVLTPWANVQGADAGGRVALADRSLDLPPTQGWVHDDS